MYKRQHIHFNDRGHTVPGHGDFPMKEYYDAIKRRGYDGTVSFEICDRRYYCDPDKAIDDIVSWMKKKMCIRDRIREGFPLPVFREFLFLNNE